MFDVGAWVLAMSSFDHNDKGAAGWSATTAVDWSGVGADAADDGIIFSIARTVVSTARWIND